VLDAEGMRPILRRMAGELLERDRDLEQLMLVGIHTRGVPLADAPLDNNICERALNLEPLHACRKDTVFHGRSVPSLRQMPEMLSPSANATKIRARSTRRC